jgi:8-oxo-dGTP diphosphatase
MLQVVAGILAERGRILIGQRSARQSHPLQWEFPGGKVEPGETFARALKRELEEELGIRKVQARELTRYQFSYPGKQPILLIFFQVTRYAGEVRNRIFQDLRWETPERLCDFDFVEGDYIFLQRLSILGLMKPIVPTIDPAQNEFLASLEGPSKKPSPFFRVMANRPEALKTFVPFYGAVAGAGSVDRRVKELVYLTVSYANHCAFCAWAHEAGATKAGITAEEMQAVRAEQAGHFTPAELAAIGYARELTRTASAAETRATLLEHFTSEQVVEITLLAAMANFTNRFNNGLVIEPAL